MTIFNRPRARPPLAAVSSQQNLIAVSTEDELLAALTSLPRSDGACYGRGVNIVGDITLKNRVSLSSIHNGILITSSSKARISTASQLQSCFDVDGNDITIENLVAAKHCDSFSFVRIINASGLSVRNNVVALSSPLSALVSFSQDQSFAYSVSIENNKASETISIAATCSIIKGISIPALYGYLFNSSISQNANFRGFVGYVGFDNCSISNNQNIGSMFDTTGLTGTYFIKTRITGNSITSSVLIQSPYSELNCIIGNAINAASIDTSFSAGRNTIIGNVGTTAISPAFTDAVTSNT